MVALVFCSGRQKLTFWSFPHFFVRQECVDEVDFSHRDVIAYVPEVKDQVSSKQSVADVCPFFTEGYKPNNNLVPIREFVCLLYRNNNLVPIRAFVCLLYRNNNLVPIREFVCFMHNRLGCQA